MYVPSNAPPTDVNAGFVDWLQRELTQIAATLQEPGLIRLTELTEEPQRPRSGQLVLADGTSWNPGSGAGFYGYYGGGWVKLG